MKRDCWQKLTHEDQRRGPLKFRKKLKWQLSGCFSSCHIRFWALLKKVTQRVIHHPHAGKTVCTHCGPETRIIHPVPTGLFSPQQVIRILTLDASKWIKNVMIVSQFSLRSNPKCLFSDQRSALNGSCSSF